MAEKGKNSTARKTGKNQQGKKTYKPGIEALIAFVIVLFLFLFFFLQAPQMFRVKEILFQGAYMVSELEIRDAANITEDDTIFGLDLEAIARRVEEIPYIKRCEVIRSYPVQVLIRVVERKAFACVLMHNRLFEIDRECYILRELTPFSLHTGPLITNLPQLTVGTPGTCMDSPELKAALSLWDAFIRLPMSETLTLSELSAESPSLLRMFFEELPYEIRWGRSEFEKQATRLNILWADKQGELPCDCYLDLRFDADLVCK
jgi:cell division septal protein FtsQ